MTLTASQKMDAAKIIDPDWRGDSDNIPWSEIELENAYEQVKIKKSKTESIQQIESSYQSALSSFSWNNTTWDARDSHATILRDLLNRLANGKGLPNQQSTVTLRDNTGVKHNLNETEVIDLGEVGSDHRHNCLEKRIDYLEQINSAITVEEVNTIIANMDWNT